MAVTVAVTGTRAEAELIVGMLRGHGVRAAVSADDAGGVDLALQAQGVRVLVPEAQATKARALLQDEPASAQRMNRLQRWVVRLLGGSRDA
jgi:hypothetical protein